MPDFGRWTSNGGDPSLNEINRTDQFLDALAAQEPVYATDRGEAELANLLAGWRDDVRETPMGELLTTNEAAQALDRVTPRGRGRRLSLAVVGSAAAAVLCLGGFGAVVAGAGPGDALYGLRTMLFGEQTTTRDDAVILAAQTEMAQVQELIEQGDWQAAQDKLQTITTTVATVNDVESKQELVTQWQELTVKVEAQDPAAIVEPGAPPPVFPEVPVVELDPGTLVPLLPGTTETSETTTSETTTSETTTSTSETTSETSTSETATSETSTSATSTSPTETSSPVSETPPTTTSPSATSPSTSPTPTTSRSPVSTTTTTSTSVIAQLSTTAPSPSSAAPPSAAAPSARSTTTPVPSPTPTVVPSPTPAPLPTTTTLGVAPVVPG
ncbi:MAG: anti-sigma-D factor RsdA [Mycobacterium sp.]